MKKRVGAAWIGLMLVVAGCGGTPQASAPVSAPPSPTQTAAASSPAAASAAPTATPTAAAATPAAATAAPAASSTPQPSAAAATPSAAVATAAPVKETATATPVPVPTPTPAPASAAPPPSAKPQAADGGTTTAAEAQALFKDNCMACHGASLEGDFGPNLTKVGSRKTKDQIVQQIVKGKGDMPPFQEALKPEEIEALATWLAAKK
ncbi:c-type cytochrome [Paenibacillus aceris]|uniref:Mono/diheme cytochrome c family protein n=1 Tax=Paenibacillus aceris TaxID=869555 RepID=A0ABS4IB58_9BACL|nr:cytochrome c [Paenibacillus aceris]MBP1967611.1 mono/diheme cytochrome c family protein [Paenibacillus aceris]NHW39130.1 cytochrome c [Paenibacillus aceris]